MTGSSSGEFTLWNGLMFKFETILQAHDNAIRCMRFTNNHNWLLTADHGGVIKYWETSMNMVKVFTGHKDTIAQAVKDATPKLLKRPKIVVRGGEAEAR